MPRHLAVLILLAVTQITGWGVVGVLPVMAAGAGLLQLCRMRDLP
ncbi:hypothetical protein [Achromobacter sp. NCFB-sbj8-Ac1-l]